MDEVKTKIETLTEHAGELLETYYQLAEVKINQKISNGFAMAFVSILLLGAVTLFMLFLSLGAARWLGHLMHSPYDGYFIIAGVYLLIVLLLCMTWKKTILPIVRNIVIKKIYE